MPAAAPSTDRRRPRIALVSDQRLVAEAVAAALASRGFDPVVLAWPQSARDERLERQVEEARPDVGLLLYDVDLSLPMTRARAALRSWPGCWLALTPAPPGAAWGGLLSAGAAAVAADDLGLDRLVALVHRLVAGWTSAEDPASAGYLEAWRAVQEQHGGIQEQLDLLAPRERDVLELLRRGDRVIEIAHRWGLTEATVRAQVRAVLRKLGVRSQLAAVARLRAVDTALRAARKADRRDGERDAPGDDSSGDLPSDHG